MNIVKLELVNFRNYCHLKLKDLTNKNIIIGSNGSGKTSVLESIYVGSLTKTFKNSTEEVLIKQNEVHTSIKIEIKKENRIKKLEVRITQNGKKTKINGNIKKRLSDYISEYKVIVFSPDEIKLIKDSPAIRRNYLNIQISQINKYYINKLNNYNRLIKNKNDYLKKMYLNKNLDERYLDVLDEKIAELGYEIYNYRKDYITKVNENLCKIFQKIKKETELVIKYNSDFKELDEISILKLLRKTRKKEINLGLTSTGIHRDDYEFLYNGASAKDFCSQGIQKLIILAMKLSENELIIKYYGIYPILLLDDLFSELDVQNQNCILKILSNKNQIFITTTDINNVNENIIKKANVINIEKMEVIK